MEKVAIVGFTKHRERAPFSDASFEIWGMNSLHYEMPQPNTASYPDWKALCKQNGQRFDRWFQAHSRDMVENRPGRERHINWLRGADIPVYVLNREEWADLPNAKAIPKYEIEKKFQYGHYHTSSVSWMMGTALLEGFKEIHIYGIDMASDSEYVQERPACEFWLGVAAGMGAKIFVPEESDLLQTVAQYGFGMQHQFRRILRGRATAYESRIEQVTQNLSQLRQQKEQVDKEFLHKEKQLLKQLHHFEGRVIELNDMHQNWTVPEGGGGASFNEGVEGQTLELVQPNGKPVVNRIEETVDG